MTDRRTGRFVRLELVWRGDVLTLGGALTVLLGLVTQTVMDDWVARTDKLDARFPTRAEAEGAVERAVIERMGGVDG